MNAREIYDGSDAEATRLLYRTLEAIGTVGCVAKELFRAQKASARAKKYKHRFVRRTYEKKQWSLGNLSRALTENPIAGVVWGWGRDRATQGYSWVLYVEIPTGQVSFHSPFRGDGPDFVKEWDGARGESHKRIVKWTQQLLDANQDVRPKELPDYSAEFTDDSAVPFGKYLRSETPCRDVPDAYLSWFLRQDWSPRYGGLVVYANRRLGGESHESV